MRTSSIVAIVRMRRSSARCSAWVLMRSEYTRGAASAAAGRASSVIVGIRSSVSILRINRRIIGVGEVRAIEPFQAAQFAAPVPGAGNLPAKRLHKLLAELGGASGQHSSGPYDPHGGCPCRGSWASAHGSHLLT